MKTWIGALVLLLCCITSSWASTEPRCGELTLVIKCENFDEGNPGGWPGTNESSWIGSSGVGPLWQDLGTSWTSGTVFAELVTDTPCGARGRSLHQRTYGTASGGTGYAKTQLLEFPSTVTEVRIRYNMCMDLNWDSNFLPAGDSSSGMHMFFFDTAAAKRGYRFDVNPYGSGEPSGSTNATITYNGTTYVVHHPWGPQCGNNSSVPRGYFNIASPSGWLAPGFDWLWLSGDYRYGETAPGGSASTLSPNKCKNIHDVFFTGTAPNRTPRWVAIEVGIKILPAGTSFTCSVTCPSRLGLATFIVDGVTVLTDWPLPPDPGNLDISRMYFDQFSSDLTSGNVDGYYDDYIITSDYSTVIGLVDSSGGSTPSPRFSPAINLRVAEVE